MWMNTSTLREKYASPNDTADEAVSVVPGAHRTITLCVRWKGNNAMRLIRQRITTFAIFAGKVAQRVAAWFAASRYDARPLPWRDLFRLAIPLWLITRLLALVVTYFSQTMLLASVVQSPHGGSITLDSLINSWGLWDGGFYGHIAHDGYTRPIDAGFWPLYPLLSRPFDLLLGDGHVLVALLIVSNLATLAAFVLIGALALHEDDSLDAASRAMKMLAAAPLALFLVAAYSDSLFLALATATLLCARRGAWRAATFWAFLAALSRPLGIILIVPLLWEYGRRIDWQHLRKRFVWERLPRAVPLATAVPLGVGVFTLYCWQTFHDPLAWMHAEALFSHVAMMPWDTIGYTWQQFWALPPATFEQARVLIDVAPLVFVGIVTVATIRRIPASYSLYLAGLLLVCLSSPVVGALFPEALVSVGRYLLAAIPIYIVLARWMHRYRWLDTLFIGGGFALQSLLMAFVLTGGWLV